MKKGIIAISLLLTGALLITPITTNASSAKSNLESVNVEQVINTENTEVKNELNSQATQTEEVQKKVENTDKLDTSNEQPVKEEVKTEETSNESVKEEIEEVVDETKKHINSSLSFDSLDNLVRGGRIPRAVSVVTGMLGIKLILEVKDGVMALKGKVRGSKKAVKKIISDMEELGIRKDLPVIVVNVNNDEICNALKAYLEENNIDYIEGPVGCSVGIHSGDKAVPVKHHRHSQRAASLY